MPHHVYANGHEIASKSSDGSSTGAAPDVCMSPPGPSAGPVAVPYNNTCLHSDLSNLARSVFVGGTGMALEDSSYFSTSYGDEGATSSYAKGIISGKIKGKCYFQSWSPNVKAEGLCVTRHMDLVTHNHVNQSNTGPVMYNSRQFDASVCQKDQKKINKNCKPKKSEEKDSAKKAKNKRGNIATVLTGFTSKADGIAKTTKSKLLYKPSQKRGNQWIEDYCDGLWANKLPKDLSEQLKAYRQNVIALNEKIQNMSAIDLAEFIVNEALAQIPDAAVKKELTEMAAKALVKAGLGAAAAGTVVGIVVAVALWTWTAYDMLQFKNKLTDMLGDAADEYMDMMMNPEQVKAKLQEQVNVLNDDQTPNKLFAALQELKANSNPCIKARKCQLTTYNNSHKINGNKSCCPGQTGHHLLPDSMFRTPLSDEQKKALFNTWYDQDYKGNEVREKVTMSRDKMPRQPCWQGYSEKKSLIICVEGGSSSGSHGMLHDETTKMVDRMRRGGRSEIHYTKVRNKIVDLVNDKYGCNKQCLTAQLDDYYGKAYTCGDVNNAMLVAHTGKPSGAPSININRSDEDV